MTAHDLWKISLVLTLMASAGNALASSEISATTAMGNSSFTPSSHVTITVSSGGAYFAAYSQHQSGNRIFFCTNSSIKYYYGTKDIGTIVSLSPTSTQDVPSGWSSL